MPTDSPQDRSSPIESLFADYLAQLAGGATLDFEDLCCAHPEQAEALRALHEHYENVEKLVRAVGERSGSPPSLAEQLKRTYGEGVDPEISLDAAPAAPPSSTPTTALVARLKEHGFAHSRYRLEGEFARGGMGAILKIWDHDLRRHLAMKVILGRAEAVTRSGTPPVDGRHLARFLEEAQVTGQLDHPGIVPVHELGLDADGRVYFTMKLVKGRDLKRVFDLVFEEQEGWNETRALSVILKVCEAMAYAHTKGVIHRDLKPANVMVGNFGEVYVMDWGLARVLSRGDSHDIRIQPQFTSSLESVKTDRRQEREEQSNSPVVTMDGTVVGTPAYMPPEQARGEIEKLTPRSDVYAIGAMLYHLLARQSPYSHGTRVSNRTLLAMVLQGPPVALSSLRDDLPAELVAICEKAMAREASQRYADTLKLAEDLRAYLEHRVVRAYEAGAWAEARKWVQRNKPLAAALAGAILILIVGIVFSTLKTREAEAARVETAQKNIALDQSNIALTEQRNRADGAAENAKSAALEALRQERIAKQNLEDVLSLSAIQELSELVQDADRLWPAEPRFILAYETWLARATLLIEGRAADPARGVERKFGLADHKAKLAQIRQRAKPLTDEQREADRRASAKFAEWEKARGEQQWLARMLGESSWPSEAEIEAELSKENLTADANGLNSMARKLVDTDPAKIAYGGEVRGLALARRAVAAAVPEERGGIRETLAWALYRTGKLDEALAEARKAIEDANEKQKDDLTASLKTLEELTQSWRSDEGRKNTRRTRQIELEASLSKLSSDVEERQTYEFDDARDRWWNGQLAKLVSDFEALRDPKTGLMADTLAEPFGWGMSKRDAFARTIEERSVSGTNAQRRWDEALAAIASSPEYGGLKLAPQLGLVPIGSDPESGLWEFAHLQTGDEAQRGPDGKLVVTEKTGLVFVLIPSGKCWMGAQKTDPKGLNFDPQARPGESPVHEVELSAYFLSKYEMTQGQWMRLTGINPSCYGPSFKGHGLRVDLRHPVESVSWLDGMSLMERLGLSLPSETQWENGCRAGSGTPWWTGDERELLRGKVNLADQTFVQAMGQYGFAADWPDLDDGWVIHAPVGTFASNPLGLHEVHGNVWEWCLDGHDAAFYRTGRRKNPVSPPLGSASRVMRGSSFGGSAPDARSAFRGHDMPEFRSAALGVRPARTTSPASLTPPPSSHVK